jgi:hypothetical protein
MSETEMIEEEQEANPYNMKKSWHKADGKRMPQADELYYEDEAPSPKASRRKKSAPNEDSSTTNHNYKKRYDDLKRKHNRTIDEFKQKESNFQAQLQATQPKYEAPKSQEELQQFRDSNPDLYETVESVAHNIASEQLNTLQPRLSAIEAREHQLAIREAEELMRNNHPDYDDIKGSEDFHTWASDQPEQIQDWVYRNPDNVSLASKAIDLYKMESGQGQSSTQRSSSPRQQSSQSAADMVSTKTTNVEPQQKKIWTETEISKMSLDQFDKHEADIRLAIDEGRVRNI